MLLSGADRGGEVLWAMLGTLADGREYMKFDSLVYAKEGDMGIYVGDYDALAEAGAISE